MSRRVLIVALLVYFTLDFCLPTMPGAFAFYPEDSVAGIEGSRARAAIEDGIKPPTTSEALVLPRRIDVPGGLAKVKAVSQHAAPVVNRLPRSTLDPTPPAEDPH